MKTILIIAGACVAASCRCPQPQAPDAGQPVADSGVECQRPCGAACCSEQEDCVGGVCQAPCPDAGPCGSKCCGPDEVCRASLCTPALEPACDGGSPCPQGSHCDLGAGRCFGNVRVESCDWRPDGQMAAPRELWQFSSQAAENESLTTPLAADLDGDGLPEVIGSFLASANGLPILDRSVIRALSGQDGHELWSTPSGLRFAVCELATGDLEGAGQVLIFARVASGQIMALDGLTGHVVWDTRDRLDNPVECPEARWPSVADVNGDGKRELICGNNVFDQRGVLGWVGPTLVVRGNMLAADIDGDGEKELLTGGGATRLDGGTVVWTHSGYGGKVVVADLIDSAQELGADGLPELVVSGLEDLALINPRNGQLVTRVKIPYAVAGDECGTLPNFSRGGGGAPVVADLDGDGLMEVGVSAVGCYSAFKLEKAARGLQWRVLWTRRVGENSAQTGAAAFDFNGDGLSEIVYGGESRLYLFDSSTGRDVMEPVAHCSGTYSEYAPVVDLDGDGHAEILIGDSTYYAASAGCDRTLRPGIRALSAPTHWASARLSWEQYDNVTLPGTMRGATHLGDPFKAPDLALAMASSVIMGSCASGFTLWVRVSNRGERMAPPLMVAALDDQGRRLASQHTLGWLQPGQSQTVRLEVGPVQSEAIELVVDPDIRLTDCRPDNNRLKVAVGCR